MRILRASWVLPVTSSPIAGGAVAVSEGRVEWVGAAASAPEGTSRLAQASSANGKVKEREFIVGD